MSETPLTPREQRTNRIVLMRDQMLDPERDESTTPLAALLDAFEAEARADAIDLAGGGTTLPQWLAWRFGDLTIEEANGPETETFSWEGYSEHTYWEHEAEAVQRAVVRGGFRTDGEAEEA